MYVYIFIHTPTHTGKSTLNGHLLYLLGEVDKRTMHKNEKESKEIGMYLYTCIYKHTYM